MDSPTLSHLFSGADPFAGLFDDLPPEQQQHLPERELLQHHQQRVEPWEQLLEPLRAAPEQQEQQRWDLQQPRWDQQQRGEVRGVG